MPAYVVPASAYALVVLFAVQVQTTGFAFAHGIGRRDAIVMIVTGLLETGVLALLYRAYEHAPRAARIAAFTAVPLLIAGSLISRDTNVDAYAYIGYGRLASFHAAYVPPQAFFDGGGFSVINEWWGPRLPALVYGPLWLLLDRLETQAAPSYALAFLIVRIASVCWLIGILASLRALRMPASMLALVALNPAIYYYYVVEAHNDLLAIFLVIAGMAIAVRRPLLGASVAALAGLVKVTFVAIALLAAASNESLRTRIFRMLAIVAVVAAGSALFGGSDYLHAMSGRADLQLGGSHRDSAHTLGYVLHGCLALIAAIATGYALLRNVFRVELALSYTGISAIVYPWYLGWGAPYALRASGGAAFFVAFPALAHIMDPDYAVFSARPFAGMQLVALGIVAVCAFGLWRDIQPRLRSQDKRALCGNEVRQ